MCLCIAFSLCGCGIRMAVEWKPGREALFTVNGNEFPMPEAKILLMEYQYGMEKEYSQAGASEFWKQKTQSGETFEEYLKNQYVLDELILLKTLNLLWEEEKPEEFSEEAEKAAANAGREYYLQMTGPEKEMSGASEEDAVNLMRQYRKAELMQEALTAHMNQEVSQEEARVISISHILLRADPGDQAGREIARGTAERLLEQIRGGEDFDSLAAQYNQDSRTRYVISRGETEEAFEKMAFSLESGEVSEAVETENGFEIIKVLNSYEEALTASNREKIREARVRSAWQEECREYLEDKSVAVNTSSWDKAELQESQERSEKRFFEVYRTYFPES